MSAARLAALNLRYNEVREEARSWEARWLAAQQKLDAMEAAYEALLEEAKRLASELARERSLSAGPGWKRPRTW